MNYFPKNVFVKIVRKFIQFWHSYRKKYILHFDKSRGVFCCPGITECEIGFNLIIQLENVNVYDISVATFGMLYVGLGHLNFEAYLSYLRFFSSLINHPGAWPIIIFTPFQRKRDDNDTSTCSPTFWDKNLERDQIHIFCCSEKLEFLLSFPLQSELHEQMGCQSC